MAKNYLDKWEEEDEEFKPNERLAEVLELVKKGVVKQKVYEELLRTTRETALGITRASSGTQWRQRAIIGGHLFRRVSKKRWKKNWFALYSNKIEWFKSKNNVLLGSVAITEEHYCSDYSTSNNTGKGGVRPFGFMLSNFEDTIYLAATSKDLKQYWIERIQQVIKKLKSDARLEDKPVLLNNPKPVSLETRMEKYRASVRKREEKEAGIVAGKGDSRRATAGRGSVQRQRGSVKGRSSVKPRGRGTQTSAAVGVGAGAGMASGGRVSARRNGSKRSKVGRKGSKKKQGSVRRQAPVVEEGSSEEYDYEQSESGSLSIATGGVAMRKKFSLKRQHSNEAIPQKVEFDSALTGQQRESLRAPAAPRPKIRVQFAEKGTSLRSSVRGSVPKKAANVEDTQSEQRVRENMAIRELRKKRDLDEESFDSSFSKQLATASLGSYQKPNLDKKLEPNAPLTSLFGTVIPNLLDRIRGGMAGKELEDEEKKDEDEEEDLKNIPITKEVEAVVEKKFGLLVRTESYEQGLTEEVELAKKENEAAKMELEKVEKVGEALDLQEQYQQRALMKAEEQGDMQNAEKVAEELKETQQIAEKQEDKSAEIWVQRQKLKDELAEKERELAKLQVAREVAQETSRQAEKKLESEQTRQKVNEKIQNATAALEEAEAASLLAQKAMQSAQEAARKVRERAAKDKETIKNVEKEIEVKEIELKDELGEIEQEVVKVKHKTAVGKATPQLLNALEALEKKKEETAEEVKRLSEGRKILGEHRKQLDTKEELLEDILKEEEEQEKAKSRRLLGGGPRPISTATLSTKGRQKKEEMSKSHLNFLANWQKEDGAGVKTKPRDDAKGAGEESEDEEAAEFVVDGDGDEDGEVDSFDAEFEELKKAAQKLSEEEKREAEYMFYTEQITTLIQTIEEFGEMDKFGRSCIKFKELSAKYEDITDGLVGILLKAKEAKRVAYKGDMLILDRHGDTVITVV